MRRGGKKPGAPFLKKEDQVFAYVIVADAIGNGENPSWMYECFENGNCKILQQEYYKILYLSVVNGFPVILENPESKYSLEIPFKTLLQKNWLRDYSFIVGDPREGSQYENREYFWDSCQTSNYLAAIHPGNWTEVVLTLPNNLQLRLNSTLNSLLVETNSDRKITYYNSIDSWVDVFIKSEYHNIIEKPAPQEDIEHTWISYQAYRVYGYSPDIYDAPDKIIENFNFMHGSDFQDWPPIDEYIVHKTDPDGYREYGTSVHITKTCFQYKNTYGNVQYNNMDSIENVYLTSKPKEVAAAPIIKGLGAGLLEWNYSDYIGEIVYDIVSMRITHYRIEQYTDSYKCYLKFGGEYVEGEGDGNILKQITIQEKWDSRIYGIIFTFTLDGTITINSQGIDLSFPSTDDSTVLLDTDLNINRFLDRNISSSLAESVLSESGIIELDRLVTENTENLIGNKEDFEYGYYNLMKKSNEEI